LIAGEASGDLHGSLLVRELKKLHSDLELYGLGGSAMEKEGVQIFFDLPSIAALGLGDVLRQYFQFRKIFYETLHRVLNEIKPDLLILIDYPGFNIRFAKKINRRIPVLYYISPQVWAWGRRRIKTIARIVDRMLVFLPFEVAVYKGTGIDCHFVGHPLIDLVRPSKPAGEIRREWNLEGEKVVSLLPGSRKSEVKRILPILLETAKILASEFPRISFLMTESATIPQEIYDHLFRGNTLPIKRIKGRMYDALAISDFAIVASGTATLETAISLKPFLIVYKTAWSTYFLGRRLIRIPYIGLVNVLAGKKIVPEFIQQDASAQKIAKEATRLLSDEKACAEMIQSICRVRDSLGEPGAPCRAARAVLELIQSRSKVKA